MDVRTASDAYPRQKAWILHAGDTWTATDKLTVNYGLRWDYYSPSSEKYDRLAFFDQTGVNPAAGGRLGSLAYAGTEWGAASYGARYPEKNWYGGFAPRLGATYALNDKTLIRAGWGLFYDRAFVPGWGGGMNQDGFNSNVSFASSLNGVQPAFDIDNGFPQDFLPPPFITAGFRNGSSLMYRTLDANERPRSQQWNLTVDREIRPGFTLGLAYVGTRGARVPSANRPLNAIDPSFLSLGPLLDDEFQPGMASLNGVPLPYAGWVEQMTSCAPTVAQALLPYPQYCSSLQGLNENHGKSTYHSLQAKVEKRFSRGTYFLVSYTLGRIYTSGSDNTQSDATTWSGASGSISPFEESRNRALATDDVTHVLSAALVWDLPIGQGLDRCQEHAPRRVAALGDLPLLLGYPVLLPLELLQRPRPVPGGLHPGGGREHLCAGLRQPRGDPADLQQGCLRVGGFLQLLLRHRRAGHQPTASPATATPTSLSSRTPGCSGTSTCSSGSRPSTCGTGTTGTGTRPSGAATRSTPTSTAPTSGSGTGLSPRRGSSSSRRAWSSDGLTAPGRLRAGPAGVLRRS